MPRKGITIGSLVCLLALGFALGYIYWRDYVPRVPITQLWWKES